MADSMEPYKMLQGRPLLPWLRNFGKFGLFLHKIAYKLACMPDRPDMFGPTRGPTLVVPWVSLVAMAMTFALGAESSRLPACSFCKSAHQPITSPKIRQSPFSASTQ